MAKPKSPFFSMGARGSIADTLTFQKRGTGTIARTKPIPTDPYSLPQAYQRWDYRDYAYWWTLLSNAEKQVYRTNASRYHITGFSLWMREHLKDLSDIALRWHLDEKSGAVAYDSSKNANNGIITGASPATGLINGCFLFDGLNDKVQIAHNATLDPTELSLELFIYFNSVAGEQFIVSNRFGLTGYFIRLQAGKLHIYIYTTAFKSVTSVLAPVIDTWYHVCATYSPTLGWMILYIDGLPNGAPLAEAGAITHSGVELTIGASNPSYITGLWVDGYIDNFIFHNRALDATEVLRHSGRRYPVK